jgi:hypothetical protein
VIDCEALTDTYSTQSMGRIARFCFQASLAGGWSLEIGRLETMKHEIPRGVQGEMP